MKNLISVVALLFLVGCSPTTQNTQSKIEEKKLSVYTSFYTMYDFANKIGGDKVNLINMLPTGQEPHDFEPSTADITNLEKADVFIYNGVGLEHWVDDVLESLQNDKLIKVNTSEGVTLIKSTHSHEQEEDHEDFDSHIWLDPTNAKKQLENIKNAFVKSDPQNKDFYEGNYTKYALELDQLDKKYTDTISALPNKDIIVTHEAYAYLCAKYGLTEEAIEGLNPYSEPEPAKMTEIIDFAKQHNVKTIFFEELASSKVADTIANEIGAKVSVLSTLEGLTDDQIKNGEDYISVMYKNLEALEDALK